ncbi:ABC transporter ATP-binding protein [Halovibrio sp. HP20-50]|uniref:ABC transporter ATP-binding protein n=1 Tax=Halovibrio sp. HP20-59 TaxID=3080275 RepID=UPI00294AC4B1|nr:ABC transporter ATP-binding protein [Halovibrio sp. HP20-59]MEA2120522.1 ABC transporter ATP-binding protein [Halovibrio sp. HP20-59]
MAMINKLFASFLSLMRILSISWKSSRKWTFLSTFFIAIEIISGLGVLYLLKQMVDVVTSVLAEPEAAENVGSVLYYVVLTGLGTLAYVISRALAGYSREVQGMMVADYVDNIVQKTAISVDLAFYESPLYHDTLERARQSGSHRPAQVASNLMLLGKNAVMLTAIVVLLGTINWRLLPIILFAVIPALIARIYFTRILYDWQRRRTQMERRAGYLDWLMTSNIHAKELRLNQLGDFLRHKYKGIRDDIRGEKLAISRKRTIVESIVAAAASIIFFTSLGYLAWNTAQGNNSVGDLVLFLLIFQRAQTMGQELVQQLSKLYEDHLYMGMLFEFMDMRHTVPRSSQPEKIIPSANVSLKLENVSFAYPGTHRDVIKNVNMEIKPGQIVALVGANGSGKTSLIKLMTRLYDPTEGGVKVNGINAQDCDIDEYRQLFSVIFQDYSHYAESVHDNIRFGHINGTDAERTVPRAAENAGAATFIEEMDNKYDTLLTRLFDNGKELSVGQWQKIALARAFMLKSNIVILDEPTSAMDPVAESELFENFRERINHRSALVISHRLSTIRLADYIYVMDDGEIKESGTHESLFEKKGIYHDIFSRQAKYYQHDLS